ncbi:MAG TPA: hypothetical protein VFU47_10390 [Armatimonadota bacterium]|nr:hypothetical protein [Armatimonadota bacterium]
MPKKPKIGQYRHTPGTEMRPGPDGVLRPTRTRRRFPYSGIIFLLYAIAGPLVGAGVTRLFQITGTARFLPQHLDEKAFPPAPSLNNVLFGAGVTETILASGLAGFWLWNILWKARVAPDQKAPTGAAFRSLLPQALVLGPLMAFLALPIGVMGLYIRTAPANQPWAVRPFFALLAAPFAMATTLYTVVPLVLIALGLLLGAVTALGVAFLWQQFPEEPLLK